MVLQRGSESSPQLRVRSTNIDTIALRTTVVGMVRSSASEHPMVSAVACANYLVSSFGVLPPNNDSKVLRTCAATGTLSSFLEYSTVW